MREKVHDLIYLDAPRYISLDNLRVFYWGIIIIPFSMLVMSVVSINMTGVNCKSLFPLISYAIWSLLYWIFVLTIQSKRTKKSFKLRFLVNGISGLFLSSLFWIFVASFNLTADTPFIKFDFFLWALVFYFAFSLVYILGIILCVHKGVFALIRKKGKAKTAFKISAFFASLIPCSGLIGMYASRFMRTHASISIQHSVMTTLIILLLFLPALAHINFVQFYYCKKYGIDCDEYGNTTSPDLERTPMKNKSVKGSKQTLQEKANTIPLSLARIDGSNTNPSKKKISLILKILIGIASIPIIFFIVFFLVFFLKGFIQGIS